MKRYFCTVATGLLLALVSTGSAAAGLPLLGNTQDGSQSTSFGDQTVGEQKNDADVNQSQGNGNVNVSPAIAVFGDATTWNAQGNGNTARADVDQSNTATQTQESTQSQELEQSGSEGKGRCCGGQSQTGEQSTDFGDQTVDKQKNEAEVNQSQGNGNLNISPAIAIFGDATTKNAQGNGNTADANVDQGNTATQSQSSSQSQSLEQGGSSSQKGSKSGRCCGGQSQTGTQETTFGDQTVGEQKNDADVNQSQGNGNVNVSPAIAIGGHESSCNSKCGGDRKQHGGASTFNSQGNGNIARANVGQSNEVTQSQSATQTQNLRQPGGTCCKPHGGWKPPENGCKPAPHGDQRMDSASCGKGPKGGCRSPQSGQFNAHGNAPSCTPAYEQGGKAECCDGEVQTASQSAGFGNQTVGKQKNDASVTQKQGNENANVSPALGIGEKKHSCGCKHAKSKPAHSDASTWNFQGNGNAAQADVDQGNTVDQSQASGQHQSLAERG